MIKYCLAAFVLLGIIGVGGNLFVPSSPEIPRKVFQLTSGDIAVSNLESQIASLENLVDRFPERDDFNVKLFDLISTRMQFLGTYDEDLTGLAARVAEKPNTGTEYALKARYLTVIHEFSAAQEALESAKSRGVSKKFVESMAIPLRLARRQKLSELQRTLGSQDGHTKSFRKLLIAAGVEAELGNFELADSFFEQALASNQDSSPFPIAYLYFQRGVMWGERADNTERAKAYYLEATRYLPQFVTAQVHLAEILFESGDLAQAEERLRSVLATSDPEPASLLGEILIATGRAKEGEGYIERARSAYESLLRQYPLAFADHGSEFFTGPGAEPERGLALAKQNLDNRQNQRAYTLAIRAALASEEQGEVCDLISRSQRLKPADVPLLELSKTKCALS